MEQRNRITTLYIICFLGSFAPLLQGCTEFRVIAKDKTVVVGRSMEWGEDMHSQIVIQPRGKYVRLINP